MQIGVLALQGGYGPHRRVLEQLGHDVVLVRNAGQIASLDGLVLPGGESTTQLELIRRYDMRAPLDAFVASQKPVLATCAGLILAARRVVDPPQPSFGWLEVDVARNAWGRQLDSFEAVSDGGTPLVLIRAPRIMASGEGVEVVDTLDGEPVMVRQGAVVGATFHPELAGVTSVHAAVF